MPNQPTHPPTHQPTNQPQLHSLLGFPLWVFFTSPVRLPFPGSSWSIPRSRPTVASPAVLTLPAFDESNLSKSRDRDRHRSVQDIPFLFATRKKQKPRYLDWPRSPPCPSRSVTVTPPVTRARSRVPPTVGDPGLPLFSTDGAGNLRGGTSSCGKT